MPAPSTIASVLAILVVSRAACRIWFAARQNTIGCAEEFHALAEATRSRSRPHRAAWHAGRRELAADRARGAAARCAAEALSRPGDRAAADPRLPARRAGRIAAALDRAAAGRADQCLGDAGASTGARRALPGARAAAARAG